MIRNDVATTLPLEVFTQKTL